MTTAKPTLDMLRSLTDEHVLRALLAESRLTRAELATRTGISKPTISDSVRRLTDAGLVRDTGERTTGRGRVGSYFALSDDLGSALVVSLAPEGVVVERVDVQGRVLGRATRPVARPVRPEDISEAMGSAAADVMGTTKAVLAVVSAADPVNRRTGRLVHVPDAPFLLGEVSPVDLLRPFVIGPVVVDNDVNWAARAERDASPDLTDVVYLYLGEGLGCAVVSGGHLVRGHRGIAGEISHMVTRGPDGAAVPLTDVFAALGVRVPGSTAIDLAEIARAIESGSLLPVIVAAICDVITGAIALTDPELIIIGGPWGSRLDLQQSVSAELVRRGSDVSVRAPMVTEPSLRAARRSAVEALQTRLVHEHR